MLSKIDKPPARRHAVPYIVGSGMADQNLSAMPRGHQTGNTVQSRPKVITVAILYNSTMNRHADADRSNITPVFVSQSVLGVNRGVQRICSVREDGAEGIAHCFEDTALIFTD